MYQNIFHTYSTSIDSKNFDQLLSGVKGNLSYALCLCLNAGQETVNELNAQKEKSPESADKLNEAVEKIQKATAQAQLRYDYFAEKWTTLIGNYRKVPSALFSLVLPYVKRNLPATSSKMSAMVFTECGKIESATEGVDLLLNDASTVS